MTEQHTQPTTATSSKDQKGKDHPDFKLKVGKTYTALKRGEFIERCSFILSNSCQCWKAGEEICVDVRDTGEVLTYQLCERHVRIQKAIDAGLLKPEKITETNPPDPVPVPYGPIPEIDLVAEEVTPPPKVEEKKPEEKKQEVKGTQTPPPSGQKAEAPKEEHHHFWDHEGKAQGEEKK